MTKLKSFWNNFRRSDALEGILIPLLAVVLALIVGVFFILWAGKDPIKAYGALWNNTFGSLRNFAETVNDTIPLIFTGLSVAFAFRCGLFNIGGEGQYLVGQMATAFIGYSLTGLPSLVHIPLVLLAGALGGALWAAVPGYLKARLGVHEVINTIMMNYVSIFLTHYLLINFMKAPGPIPFSPKIAPSAELPVLFENLLKSRLHVGIFVALLAAWLIYYLLFKTTVGYEIRAVGLNSTAAEYGGIKVSRNIVLAMVISGALAGLAGAVQVAGIQRRFYDAFGFVGYGFDGIAVALLGRNHPAGVILGAFLFGVLARGSMAMQSVAGVPKSIVWVVQASIIFFIAADGIIRWLIRRRKTVKEVQA